MRRFFFVARQKGFTVPVAAVHFADPAGPDVVVLAAVRAGRVITGRDSESHKLFAFQLAPADRALGLPKIRFEHKDSTSS